MKDILLALLLTIVIEEAIGFLVFSKRAERNFYKCVLLVNVITNLTVNLLLSFVSYGFILLETVIPFIECYLLADSLNEKYTKYLPYCLLANIASFGAGIVVFGL